MWQCMGSHEVDPPHVKLMVGILQILKFSGPPSERKGPMFPRMRACALPGLYHRGW